MNIQKKFPDKDGWCWVIDGYDNPTGSNFLINNKLEGSW
jgi:hypothetical protein